jgi:AP-2 complex subunit alpha
MFIGDIRNCQSKDQEAKVVHTEMAKIRQKFLKGGLSVYDRKKYVWKMIYAHILGYDVDFGHDVAISLINQPKFFDKSTGYISIGIMLNEKSDFGLFINCIDTIKKDLDCGNETNESLAIATLGNIGSPDLARELGPTIMNKALTDNTRCSPYIKKKAVACLISFLRRQPTIYDASKFKSGFTHLLRSTNFGQLMASCALL